METKARNGRAGARGTTAVGSDVRPAGEGDIGHFDERRLRLRPALRAARADDIAACAEVWREAMGQYLGRLNQVPPGGDLASLRRVMDHLLATDPDRFWVAERRDEGRIVGFGAATVRGSVWFLALLFVLPEEQGLGVGQELLGRIHAGVPPETIHATATDSVQPISNALYARLGIVPRVPVLHLIGPAGETDALPPLPPGIGVRAINDNGPTAGAALAAIDRAILGYERPADHAFFWRDGRRGFLFEDRGGLAVAYGYAAPSGRVGPIAALDEWLVAPVVGCLLENVPPADASSLWVPGAGGTVATLLDAGFRLDGFPALLGWDRPFAAFEKYIPATLALL